MSVRLGLMALLAEGPMYGARLRWVFEERTGGTWPLNVGQVYTTLGRLERDGLVEQAGPPDAEGRISYRLTETGSEQVEHWWNSPVDRDNTPRDELVIKLALAVTVRGVDVQGVAQAQRTATLTHLRDLTRLKQQALDAMDGATASPGGAEDGGVDTVRDTNASSSRPEPADHELAWLLVLENHIFTAEAEVRWLDHVETRLAQASHRHPRGTDAPNGARTPKAVHTQGSDATAVPGRMP